MKGDYAMAYDFNGAQEQKEFGDVIPDGTVATVQVNIRPGNAGDGGWLKRSKNRDSLGLDMEFTVVDGQYAKRKFWRLATMEGSTEGHAKAAEISGAQIRAILESVRGIRPDDESESARAARKISNWGDLDGMRFIAKIGVEKGTNGYKDKNTLALVITPDRKQWSRVEQLKTATAATPAVAPAAMAAASADNAPAAAGRPSWAR